MKNSEQKIKKVVTLIELSDINNRLTEINALLLPGEESLIFYTSSP